MDHPIKKAIESPTERPGEICMVMLPAATFQMMAEAAAKRGISPAEAMAQAFQQWLEKERSC